MDYEALLSKAHNAARQAQRTLREGHGLDCGFAWVRIQGDSTLARHCRKKLKQPGESFPDSNWMTRSYRYGNKGWPRGWDFWCPGNYRGQSVGVHEAGAKAFRDVLAEAGIIAEVTSRLD
jgi:hypothetical protein